MKQDCRVLETLRASLPSHSARLATSCFFRTFSADSQPVPKFESPSCHTCVCTLHTTPTRVCICVCRCIQTHSGMEVHVCVHIKDRLANRDCSGTFSPRHSQVLWALGPLLPGVSPFNYWATSPSGSFHQSGHTAAPTWSLTQQDRAFTPGGCPLS